MTEELKQAAQRVATAWHACGRYPDSTADIESLDAAINTLEALTQRPAAQAGEREAKEVCEALPASEWEQPDGSRASAEPTAQDCAAAIEQLRAK